MNLFDLMINFIESFTCIMFIYLIFENKKSLIIMFLFVILNTMNMSICNYYLLPEIILTLTSFLIFMSYTHYLSNNHIITNFFICFFIKTLNDISITSSILITSELIGFPFYSGSSYYYLVFFSKTIFIVLTLVASFYVKKYHVLETKKLKYLLLALCILNLIFSSITDFIFYNSILDVHLKSILIFINLLSICLFIVFIETQKEQKNLLFLQKENLKFETQEQIQIINNNNIAELNKWKHDISHVLNSIQFKINNHQFYEAKQLINEINNNLTENQIIFQTENDLLDHLLLQKYSMLKEKKIELITSYNSCICPLEDTHFSILLGNLLNNAIENCSGENKIYLLIEQKAIYYHIEIRNSIQSSVLENNPSLLTHKEDKEKHGIGLKSIKFIVKKYNGKISFHEKYNYFIVNVVIPNEIKK